MADQSQLQKLISVFENVSTGLGVDPSKLIGSIDKDKIKQCLVNRLQRNGIDIEEAQEQAEQMVNNGTEIVEDYKNKITDAASGASNAVSKMSEMPAKVASVISEGVSNLSSISANPLTLNCLPSATLSFIQNINNLKTELTSNIASAVDNLKVIDDLGLTDVLGGSGIDIDNLKAEVEELKESIKDGLASCPSAISFDYYFKDSMIEAMTNVFNSLSYLPSYTSYFDTGSCDYCTFGEDDTSKASTHKASSTHPQGQTSDFKTVCLSYSDLFKNTMMLDKWGVLGDINSSPSLLRLYVDRTSDEISTKILGTKIKLVTGFILDSRDTRNWIIKDDEGNIIEDLYDVSYVSSFICVVPSNSSKCQQLSKHLNETYKLFLGECFVGILLTYDSNYITSTQTIKTLTFNSSPSSYTASWGTTYNTKPSVVYNGSDLAPFSYSSQLISFYKNNQIISNELEKVDIGKEYTKTKPEISSKDLVIEKAYNSLKINNIQEDFSETFKYTAGEYILDEDTVIYDKSYIISPSTFFEYLPSINDSTLVYFAKNSIKETDALSVNFGVKSVAGEDAYEHLGYTYYYVFNNSKYTGNVFNFTDKTDPFTDYYTVYPYPSKDIYRSTTIKLNLKDNWCKNKVEYYTFTADYFTINYTGSWFLQFTPSEINVYPGYFTTLVLYDKTITYDFTFLPLITSLYFTLDADYDKDKLEEINSEIFRDGVGTGVCIKYDSSSKTFKLVNKE